MTAVVTPPRFRPPRQFENGAQWLQSLGGVPMDRTLRMASSGRVRLPDMAFVSSGRIPRTREPVPTLAPDLAVEVLSEGNTTEEIAQKLREYFQSGTRSAWVVDPPTRTVAVYHAPGEPTRLLTEADTLDGEQVVPGFTHPVASVFRGVPPVMRDP